MFKVGDKVIILKRIGNGSDYPFSYSSYMDDYAGKTATIIEIKDVSAKEIMHKRYYNGDDHIYKLDNNDYSWHSSMFEIIDEAIYDEEFDIMDSEGFIKEGIPIFGEDDESNLVNGEIDKVDKNDSNLTYRIYLESGLDVWVKSKSVIIDFIKLLSEHLTISYNSPRLGPVKITKQNDEIYPLCVQLQDGDILELTPKGKYFVNSKLPVL